MKTFDDAEKFLLGFVPKRDSQKFPGQLGLDRTKFFLELLGEPQEKLKIIHIAGTSGKGSTAYMASLILAKLGFRTGLHLSPHLRDIRERCQINNRLISKEKFVSYLNDVLPAIRKTGKSSFGRLTYFEVLAGLTYYIFWEKKVDYAVIETGMGGFYDGTNVAEGKDKIVVLTKIGLDHTNILGKTIKEIAAQKAGIIKENNTVVSTVQPEEAKKVIDMACRRRNAVVHYVTGKVKTGLAGEYQQSNAALAVKAVEMLGRREGFDCSRKKIGSILLSARFEGRFDTRKINGKTVVLDGAHNPQKMAAFVKSLKKMFPRKKFHFLIAFKKGKNFRGMLRHMLPVAESIAITSFFISQDMANLSEKPENIGRWLGRSGHREYEVAGEPKRAFRQCMKKDGILVVTGSLYLLSEIYPLLAE